MREPRFPGRVRVGMALYGDLTYDSRVRREARTLARAGYDISLVCLANESRATDLPENVKVLVHRPTLTPVLPGSPNPFAEGPRDRISAAARSMRWLRAYGRNLRAWGRAAVAMCGPVDIWHAHDLTGLAAIAPVANKTALIVYDSHELFLDNETALRLPRPARTLLRAYERRLVSRVSAVVTVNDGFAGVLRQQYKPRRIVVVHNCPDRWSPPPARADLIRGAAAIPGSAHVILYHGVLSQDRGIEQLMDALLLPGLEEAHLVLLGYGVKRDAFVATAGQPPWRGRVHVLDPVPPASLLSWVASADVGGVLHPASRLDHLKTPNKIFECLAAGIPVVASDFPAMRRIVIDDPSGVLGVVCDPSRVEEIAAALRSVLDLDGAATESIRARCFAAAQNRWNWEVESAGLTELYGELVRQFL